MKPILTAQQYGRLRIWDPPTERGEYVIGVDTATGRARDIARQRGSSLLYRDLKPDYSAAIVITKEHGQHVASWHGDIGVTDWAYVAAAIGMHYNAALLVPELEGPGEGVVDLLANHIRYPNLYRNRTFNVAQGTTYTTRWGWHTGPTTRHYLIARIEEALDTGTLFTRDHDLVKELRTMEVDEGGTPRAKHPNKDDRVMALGMALQGRFELMNGTLDTGERARDDLEGLDRVSRETWNQLRAQRARSERGDPVAIPGLRAPGSLPRHRHLR